MTQPTQQTQQTAPPTPQIVPGGPPPNAPTNDWAGIQKIQQDLYGQTLHPTEPQPITINGKETGGYFGSSLDMVGQDPNLPPPGGFQGPPPDQSPAATPNYDKLTGMEQWVMGALPGIPKPITDALDAFNNSWAGQALSKLDWPAEQVERFTGFAAQAAMAAGNPQQWDDFNKNLKSAWYAGSLSADMANLTFDLKANPDGSLSIHHYQDLPGVEGVIQSRQKITQLVNGGMTYDEALAKTKADYLESQGALALRAQLQDTFVHVFGDPLNALLPFIKPVEWLHGMREGILATKIADSGKVIEKLSQAADDVAKLEDGLKAANEIGDTVKAAELTSQLGEARKLADSATEAAKLEAVSKLNPADRFVIWVTGGIDTEAKTYLDAKMFGQLASQGKYGQIAAEAVKALNPMRLFELTPESKAIEFTHIVMENINSRVIAGSVLRDGTYDIDKIARAISRAASGTASPELGHMIATLEGQHVAGVLNEVAAGVSKVAEDYNATAKWERPLINMMGAALEEHPSALLKQLDAGEHAALYTRFMDKVTANPALSEAFGRLLQTNGLTVEKFSPELVQSALGVFKGNNLYDSGVAIAQMGNLIADAAAKQAIARFGLKNRGFITALSDLTKKAESLAFLKLNPAYPARNFFNNVFTMYARGALGNVLPSEVARIWELAGNKPLRLAEGIGMAGIETGLAEDIMVAGKGVSPLEAGVGSANRLIRDATAAKPGVISKLEDVVSKVAGKIPSGIDMSKWSQNIEKWASESSMATFYMRGMEQYGKAGKMWLKVADFSPELANELGADVASKLEHLTQSAYLNPAKLDALTAGEDIPITLSALREGAEAKLGRPLGNVLTDEFLTVAQDDIEKAVAARSESAIRSVFDGLNAKLDAHIEGLNDGAIQSMIDETLSRVKTEGPGSFGKVYGDAVDEWWAGHARHAIDEAKTAEGIRGTADAAIRDSQWRTNFAQGQAYWDRQWGRLEARMKGLAQGAQEAGLTTRAQEVIDHVANWKGEWKDFFTFRDQTLKDFFEAERSGNQTRTWGQVTQELDAKYQTIIQNEAKYTSQIDSIVSEMMPAEQRPMFDAWRERVNSLRTDDKQALLDFRQKIRGLPYDQIQTEYAAFTQDRIGRIQAMWQEERAGLAALQGNPEALAQYTEGVAAHTQADQLAVQVMDKKLAGGAVSPEEQNLLDQWIRQKDPATADYLDSLKGELQQAQQTAAQTGEPLTQIEKRLAQANLQEGAIPKEQGGLLARVKAAEQNVETKPIIRNWRAGNNNGTIQFASEAQRDLYDAGAASSRKIRDVGSRGVDLTSSRTANLDSIASKYGITREEAGKLASQVYADVRSQAKGISEGETRKLTDTVSGLSNKPTTAAEQAANAATRDKALSGVMADKLDPKALKDYGWTRGKPGLLSAVNADRADAGLPKYASLSEIPFDEAVKSIDKRVGTTADVARKAVLAPRSSLPPQLSDEMQQTAKRLVDELTSGSTPTVLPSGARTPSSLPDWFQELSQKYKYGREDVYKAIDKIIADAGTDKGKAVERVKQVILDAMSEVNPLTGEPPDPQILKLLGKPEEEIAKAEEAWRALGTEPPGAIPQTGNVAADLQAEITQTEQQVIEKFRPKPQMPQAAPTAQPFLPDMEQFVKPELYNSTGLDQLAFNHGHEALSVMQEQALQAIDKPPTKWADVLSPEGEARLQRYLDHVKGGYSDARYASTRFAEYGRDSALLNYNRRMNYNNILGTVMPYEFWATQSVMKWALHSIDRPAMLTTYLRMKQLLETGYRPQAGFPSRFQDMLRINLPFLPEWMGKNQFVDPLSVALPFDKFASPYEQYQNQQASDLGAATRKLQEMAKNGQISQADLQQAMTDQKGPVWDRAVSLAQQDDTSTRLNGLDFAAMFTSPHLPIQMAMNAITGKEQGAILPLTGTIGNVLGAFGLDPAGPLNPEAAIRRQLGFHPFNQWDDYYIDRELANMAGDGTISATDARKAMIDRKGPIFDQAQQRVGMEKSSGPAGVLFSLLGIPVKSYPTGEENLRQLQQLYSQAGDAYAKSGDYANTLGKFNQAHPEYEARLALYKKPDERLNQFLVDNIWSKWNEMPDLYKREISQQLGPDFQEKFLNKDTQQRKFLPAEQLGTWLKLMGGDPPGSLNLPKGQAPLTLPSQDVAYRAQTFYNGRDNFFPGVLDKQNEYFKLTTSAEKKSYLAKNPTLSQYWKWRQDFMARNPETVPYLTDLTKNKPPAGYQQNLANSDNQPHLTWDEWKMQLGWTLSNLVQDAARGEALPPNAKTLLEKYRVQYGYKGTTDDFAKYIAASH